MYTVLHQALDVAVRDGLLRSNPAAKVKRSAVARKDAMYRAAADWARLLDAAEGLRYHLAVLLMAATALRRGEGAGLRWRDFDLSKGELTVRHTLSQDSGEPVLTEPKTDRPRRRIPLHSGLMTQLKAHRKRQVAERLAAGNQGTDTGAVFATESGTICDPRNLIRTVEIAAAKNRLGGRRRSQRCGRVRQCRGLSPGCISRPRPTCSGIPRPASRDLYGAYQRRRGPRRDRRFGFGARPLALTCRILHLCGQQFLQG